MSTLVLLPLIVFALMIRTLFFEPFNIPAGSMAPTLIVGDYIFVDKTAYGYSRYSLPLAPPLFSGRIFARAPERGDVVVFALPTDPSVDYVKRIVGLPGDRIQIKQGRLYLNDEPMPRRLVGDHEYRLSNGVARLTEYVETLPSLSDRAGISHAILKAGDDGPLDNTQVYTVPAKHYFTLGDNRDNSQDSRILSTVGYIPEENLIGRAAFIYYSAEEGERSGRMLKAIH